MHQTICKKNVFEICIIIQKRILNINMVPTHI